MSKPRYKWWGYARAMIQAYPEHCNDNEREAVREALQALENYPMPETRKLLVTLYFSRKKPISVVAMSYTCSDLSRKRGFATSYTKHGIAFLQRFVDAAFSTNFNENGGIIKNILCFEQTKNKQTLLKPSGEKAARKRRKCPISAVQKRHRTKNEQR